MRKSGSEEPLYSGAKLKDISQLFSVRESAITEARRRFLLKMGQEKSLKDKVDQVKGNT